VIRISAFADEISPDPTEQLSVLREEGIQLLDLRAVWDTNVLDLDDEQVATFKGALERFGIRVAAIGSPLGKVTIEAPFAEELRRLERAIVLAQTFGTPFIRVFSFSPPSSGAASPASGYPDEVITRLRAMTERARAAGITLLHENDGGLYGETIEGCVHLLQSVDDPHLGAVLDPANFIQCGEIPYPDAYEALRPWLRAVHVKDARPDGRVVLPGEGAGRWPELLRRLRDNGFDGFLSLEPHLVAGGRYGGFSGADLFRRAAQTLQTMLQTA
jgi:sugar phosphate isomerase/epimerase